MSELTKDIVPILRELARSARKHNYVQDEPYDLAADEIERLRGLLEPCRPDTDPQADDSYPRTTNDILSLLSAYIADMLPDGVELDDEYYGAWERQARPVVERLMAIITDRNCAIHELQDVMEWQRDHLAECRRLLRELRDCVADWEISPAHEECGCATCGEIKALATRAAGGE